MNVKEDTQHIFVVGEEIWKKNSEWRCSDRNVFQKNFVPEWHGMDGTMRVASAIKSAMAELGPNEVTNRTKIEPLAQQKLAESLVQKYGEDVVFVNKVVINDMNFEDAYNEAIQQKSIAQQNADKQKIENEAAIAKAEADKQVAITNAEAEAQKTSIAAEAQAEANRKLAEGYCGRCRAASYRYCIRCGSLAQDDRTGCSGYHPEGRCRKQCGCGQ